MRVRVFTKSNWDEPPRIRHQFAKMLQKNGHEVIFYQKPGYLSYENLHHAEKGMSLVRTVSLVHHQLRVSAILSFLNSLVEKKSIRLSLDGSFGSDIVVNFNYDYYFLRDVFPNNRIITVINDDFIAQAKFLNGRHAESALRRTCRMSDEVLCVSTPLCRQVRKWCEPRLFLPWTTNKYEAPRDVSRDSVILWAHINDRIDFELLRSLALRRPTVEFHIIGPVDGHVKEVVCSLVDENDNISLLLPASLEDINFDKYFSAIIPYKNDRKEIEAVTASNKTFQLLSKGMPLIVSGMPNFINSDVIFKTNGVCEFLEAIDSCQYNFSKMQASIEALVSSNIEKHRFSEIKELFG